MPEETDAELLHDTLLRAAGWLPDDVLAAVRGLVAEGEIHEAAAALVFAAIRTAVPFTHEDADLLAVLLSDSGISPDWLDEIAEAADGVEPGWYFRDAPAEGRLDADGSALIAAVAGGELVGVLAEEPGVRGVWEAWRAAPVDVAYPPPRPVYVVEVADPAGCAGLTGRLQDLLVAAGDRAPQIEVVSLSHDVPVYQQAARARGKLLWAPEAEGEISVARVFDVVDPESGPGFDPGHPEIEAGDERARLLAYLDAGQEVLVTTALMDDVVDPERGKAVPMSFRTDGVWVWTDSVGYYLREHGLAPDPDLWRHIAAAEGLPSRPDTVTLGRVMGKLAPGARQPAWSMS